MKTWTKEMIKDLIFKNDVAVYRGIVAIYERQTQDEKLDPGAHHHNGVGFSGIDAGIMSSFAEQIIRFNNDKNPKYKNPLSPKQLELARKKIARYSRQLAEIANYNEEMKEEREAIESQ